MYVMIDFMMLDQNIKWYRFFNVQFATDVLIEFAITLRYGEVAISYTQPRKGRQQDDIISSGLKLSNVIYMMK